MRSFCEWGSNTARPQPLRGGNLLFITKFPQEFLVLILSTSEGWKTKSTLEPLSGFEHGTPGLGIQRLENAMIYSSLKHMGMI